ncbi:hypothetical protein Plim_1228 [Planctopirus limnophila DSM 3776]|uniref:Uncharacterized protein n=2 Tax=Planctopirus limnophila TaxID=120 RepID=D5SUL0_PLAL2|nr:hypothetical protein Plim_1228 [Planctopirus limnophila DSM 3776]
MHLHFQTERETSVFQVGSTSQNEPMFKHSSHLGFPGCSQKVSRTSSLCTLPAMLLMLVGTASTALANETSLEEPGWLPVVVATGPLRTQIDATPIELRPYRPLHFYGNTIRRVYYRGTPMPRVGEMAALPFRTIGVGSRTRREEFATGQLTSNRRQTSGSRKK